MNNSQDQNKPTQAQQTQPAPSLTNLPDELIAAAIAEHLDYQSLITLPMVNKRLHRLPFWSSADATSEAKAGKLLLELFPSNKINADETAQQALARLFNDLLPRNYQRLDEPYFAAFVRLFKETFPAHYKQANESYIQAWHRCFDEHIAPFIIEEDVWAHFNVIRLPQHHTIQIRNSFAALPEELKAHIGFLKYLFFRSPYTAFSWPEAMWRNKELVLYAMSYDGELFAYASETVRTDMEVILTALSTSADAISYVSDPIEGNLEAIEQIYRAGYISEALYIIDINDVEQRQFVLNALINSTNAETVQLEIQNAYAFCAWSASIPEPQQALWQALWREANLETAQQIARELLTTETAATIRP